MKRLTLTDKVEYIEPCFSRSHPALTQAEDTEILKMETSA
ncbi:hypothetical protein SAMN04488137_2624 [Fictibacillus solisalsi]|uniref:Uncharacterized protein n=1 Tax=Fictibacillus solisalsi TaxID=459525 RepID=A0A1G9X8I9_9BACL|nr:hypothetical protein SAMN04488137_2624 [Fictibacillus solisalsi]